MPRRLRIAIAGAGPGRGQIWPATVKKLDDLYELCALCEPVPERAAENERRWGVRVYTDLDTMLAEQRPDLVLAATPTDAYHVVACKAAGCGAHVISEIPLAPTRPIADMSIEATRRAGVKLEVAENAYRWASERLKQKIIRSGIVGRPTHARLWYTCGSYHGLNAVRELVRANPSRVLGYVGTIPESWHVDYLDQTFPERSWEGAIVEFDSGLVCVYEVPPPGHRGNTWEIEGTDGALVGDELLLGTGGSRERFAFQWEYSREGDRKVLDHVRVDTEPPIVWENPFKRYAVGDNDEVARVDILAGFHRSIVEDLPAEYGPERAWPDQETWIAIRQSALRDNAWIDLPLTEPTEFERRMQAEYKTLYGCPYDDLDGLSKVAFPRGGVRWAVGRQL